MAELARLTASPGDEDSWWAGDEKAPAAPEAQPSGIQVQMAHADLAEALSILDGATRETDRTVMDAAADMEGRLALPEMAETVVLIQDLRRRLALVEAYLARRAGMLAVEMNMDRTGELPDGRRWDLRRGNTRKAWDHDGWKKAARARIVERHAPHLVPDDGFLIDTETGEERTLAAVLQEVITQAQEVHGSTSPRVTALKKLDLAVEDYCEQTPGTWTVQAVEKTEDTND